MNDLEQRLKDVLESDASKAPRVARAPEGLKRDVRRRQVGTALIGTFAIVALLGVSLGGFRAIDRSEGTTPMDDTWSGYEIFERTAKIENFTITSPSDLYLVNQWPWSIDAISGLRKAAQRAQDDCKTTPRGQARKDCMDATFGPGSGSVAPIFQLSNTDRGLRTSPCVGPGLIAPNEIVLTVSYDYLSSAANFGAGDEPPWPVTYTESADYARTPCGPGVYVPFASPENKLGSYPYVAHIVAGTEVSDDDRRAVIDAFNTMEVGGIERFDAGDRPAEAAYVLAGGENATGPWTLQLRPSDGTDPKSNIDLESISEEAGAVGLGDVILDDADPIEQAGGDPVFGAVAMDASGVELRLEDETPAIPAQLVPLPPSMPFDFDLFFASNPSDVTPTAVPLGIPGEDPSEAALPTPDVIAGARVIAEGDSGDASWRLEFSAIPGENTLILRDARGGAALATLGPVAFDRLHRSGLELWPEAIPGGSVVIFGATAPAATSLAIALEGGPVTYLSPGDPQWDPEPVLTSTGLPGLRLWWSELPIDTGEIVTFSEGCEVLARKVFIPDHGVDPAPMDEIDPRIDCVRA